MSEQRRVAHRSVPGRPTKDLIMMAFLKTWIALKTDRRAVTALEYGLIAAVIAAVMVVGASTLGTNLSSKFVTLAGTV